MNRDVGLDLPPDGSMDTGPRQATVHGVPGVGRDLATKPPPPPMAQTSLVAQTVKNLPATQETRAQSLDQEDPLEKGMTTHSSILAREFHRQRSLVGYSPWDGKESDTTERLTFQSCLEGWYLFLQFGYRCNKT